jgi:predicted metalloprotease
LHGAVQKGREYEVRRIATLLILVVVLAGLAGVATTGARAINPTQTTVTGVVNYEFWDLEAFWKPLLAWYGKSYVRPGVQYYDYYDSYGRMVDFSTPCGTTAGYHGSQGFYCPGSQTIYVDFNQQTGNLKKFGDGSVGFWLAHEFGHHIQRLAGLNPRIAPNVELQADCFAGMYVRYGVSNSYRLFYNDYTEARSQIWALRSNDPSHGTPQQRLNNFDWGYNQLYYPSCVNGYN